MILAEEGFIPVNSNVSRKHITEDHIKEFKEGSLNIEISDIYKENNAWSKENKEDREIFSKEASIKDLKDKLEWG